MVKARFVRFVIGAQPGNIRAGNSGSPKSRIFWIFEFWKSRKIIEKLEVVIFFSGNIFRWDFLQKISTLSENHESGLYHQYLGQKKVGIDQKSVIVKPKFQNLENIRWPDLKIFLAEIFMIKPRFVVFRQRRYFLQKISSKNIAGEKNYDLQSIIFRLFQNLI